MQHIEESGEEAPYELDAINIDTEQSEKEEAWWDLEEERPRVIIEIGSPHFAEALTVFRTHRKEFATSRYVCIDPDIDEEAFNSVDYMLFLRDKVETDSGLKRFYDQADEIWIKNIGSLIHKDGIRAELKRLLKHGGTVIIFDNFTTGIQDEVEDTIEIFEDEGLIVENFSESPYELAEKSQYVDAALSSGYPKMVLKITKPQE